MVCHVYTFIKNGTFNHCGRSNAWNSTHHGRYVFQTAFFFVRNMNTDMCIYTYTYTIMYTYIHKNTCTKTSAITRLSGWLCGGVVWCGVVRCVVVVVSLSLVFSNLKLVRSKGFFARDNFW